MEELDAARHRRGGAVRGRQRRLRLHAVQEVTEHADPVLVTLGAQRGGAVSSAARGPFMRDELRSTVESTVESGVSTVSAELAVSSTARSGVWPCGRPTPDLVGRLLERGPDTAELGGQRPEVGVHREWYHLVRFWQLVPGAAIGVEPPPTRQRPGGVDVGQQLFHPRRGGLDLGPARRRGCVHVGGQPGKPASSRLLYTGHAVVAKVYVYT